MALSQKAAWQFLKNIFMILPVILSGGLGSRLWPLSREMHPKPFIKIDDSLSLLQKTYKRAEIVSESEEIVIVTNRDLFFYTKDELEKVGSQQKKNTFLLEPVRRNSAAAVGLAAQYALDQYGADCVLLIMSADHIINDEEKFFYAVREAKDLSYQGKLVTFGMFPTHAETGYGYIKANGNLVEKFVEKPSLEIAEKYIAEGTYFWNLGVFCMTAGTFLEELHLLAPDIAEQTFRSLQRAALSSGNGFHKVDVRIEDFEQIRSISVDYAVFEKSEKIAMVPCDIGWSDIGSWSALGALYSVDNNKNNILGNAICLETSSCIINASSRVVVTLGVNDLLVADTEDALLVAHKDKAQEVGAIVDVLKSQSHKSFREFPTVYRPWGAYTVLQEGEGFKVKRIEMKPGASLSLQSHKHRSEHWIVVYGKAVVINGEHEMILSEGQSTYIPAETIHRLSNASTTDTLVVIEVQTGVYLGEDDIERFADVYGRAC